MLRVEPGREEEFEALGAWLTASAALDRVVEATEPQPGPEARLRPLPPLLVSSRRRALIPEAPFRAPQLEATNS